MEHGELPLPAARLERAGIDPRRIHLRCGGPLAQGAYVLYWMQASIRESYNAALETAVLMANEVDVPLIVGFALTPDYPGANLRHYTFLAEALCDTHQALRKRGIPLIVRVGNPTEVISRLADGAAVVVTDRGYTSIQKSWRDDLAGTVGCPLLEVEDNVVVPVAVASEKEEYAARTIRPRIHRVWEEFFVPMRRASLAQNGAHLAIQGEPLDSPQRLVMSLSIDRSVGAVPDFRGGPGEARKRLDAFINGVLVRYDQRNDPNARATSLLSPYLHFGCISPVEIALKARKHGGPASEAFLEELIVRRELAINFVHYNKAYRRLTCLADWALATLEAHRGDERPHVYDFETLRDGKTHDPAWNAAQRQMVNTGHMAGYMRMYWGKKVIEWSAAPEEAWDALIALNDTYELDGRDPNGYCGIAWCFGKHDRPWKEREIFGKVRYMNYQGLRRKFDVEAYIRRHAPK